MKTTNLSVFCIKFRLFVSSLSILLFVSPAANAGESVIVEVASGEQARTQSVVRIQVPEELAGKQYFKLTRSDNKTAIPVQLETTPQGDFLYWILDEELPAQSKRKYHLQATKKTDAARQTQHAVTVQDDGKSIHMKIGNKSVLSYNHAIVESPLEGQPYYARSGYIHPLNTPTGKLVSDDFNPDHAHQHGIMFAWRKMLFDGRETNCWEQKNMTGRVEHAQIKSFSSGPVFGTITASLHHDDLTGKQSPVTMLNETWELRVFAISDHFLFDITSTQTCATDLPVLIKKIHYGGLAFRGHADWHDSREYDFLTSQGKTKADGNHTRPNWVQIHGQVEGESVGLTIFDHPQNFRYPQPVRLHPTMPYFCFTPAQLGDFSIEPGTPYVSKYRFCVHTGKPDATASNKIWNNYAQPIQARVLKN